MLAMLVRYARCASAICKLRSHDMLARASVKNFFNAYTVGGFLEKTAEKFVEKVCTNIHKYVIIE